MDFAHSTKQIPTPNFFFKSKKKFLLQKKKKKSIIQTKNLRPFGKIDKSVQPKMFYAKLTKRNFHADWLGAPNQTNLHPKHFSTQGKHFLYFP